MGYLCQRAPIEEGVVTAIKLKRRRGGVLPIYHRASILDYENFWISRSGTILLNNKSPRKYPFFRKKSPFFYCNGVSVVFPKPKSGLSRRSGLITSRARFLVGDRPETGSKLIINGKWTLGVFPIEEKSSPERIWNIFKTNSRFVLFMLNLSSWIIQTNPYNFTNLTKKGIFA